MIRCAHPHRRPGRIDLATIPVNPLDSELQLVLLGTEIGDLPYCGIDNERALAAPVDLGGRYMRAGIVTGHLLTSLPHPEYDYTDEKWLIPGLVLSGALAQFEERYCVAECRRRIAEVSMGRAA